MVGTLINAFSILVGGSLGLCIRKGMSPTLSESCMKALGGGVTVIGLSGALGYMLRAGADGSLSSSGGINLLISLALGTLIGELAGIDAALEKLSGRIEERYQVQGFSRGFVSASILFCSGAMTIVGSINDGLFHDPSLLIMKSVIDGIAAFFMAGAMGVGVVFSLFFVLAYQGLLTLASGLLQPVLTDAMMQAMSVSGYAIVFCIGLNMVGATRLKVANMVPALPISALSALIYWDGLSQWISSLFH